MATEQELSQFLKDVERRAFKRALYHVRDEEAALDITVKKPDTADGWAKTLAGRMISTGSVRRLQGGNVTELDGFAEGEWWVQDASSAMPARLFGDLCLLGVRDVHDDASLQHFRETDLYGEGFLVVHIILLLRWFNT